MAMGENVEFLEVAVNNRDLRVVKFSAQLRCKIMLSIICEKNLEMSKKYTFEKKKMQLSVDFLCLCEIFGFYSNNKMCISGTA